MFKTMKITKALLLLSLVALFSCSSDEDATTATELEPTTVNVTFTGLDISITPDQKANSPPARLRHAVGCHSHCLQGLRCHW